MLMGDREAVLQDNDLDLLDPLWGSSVNDTGDKFLSVNDADIADIVVVCMVGCSRFGISVLTRNQ